MTSAAWKWISPVGGGVLVLFASTVCAADLSGRAPQRSNSEPRAPLFVVRRLVDGKITALDSNTGVVEVKTAAGKLTMTARQPSAASLRKGDPVLVELGILPSAPRAVPPLGNRGQHGSDAAVVRQRLNAQVTRVNVARGTLTFQTSAGRAETDLPFNILKRFQQGDTIPVELALIPRGAPDRAEHVGLAALLLSIFGKK
jgi:hypothetical protein